jgi:hypothetical protein
MEHFSLLTAIAIVHLIAGTCYGQLPNLKPVYDFIEVDGAPGNVALQVNTVNLGDSLFESGLLGIYASLDTALITSQDSLLFSYFMSPIPANDTGIFLITIPFCDEVIASQLPGYTFGNNFYLLYKLDIGENYPESDENDNTGVFNTPLFMGCITGTEELFTGGFSVYPNPGDGRFTLKLPATLHDHISLSIQNVITQARSVMHLNLQLYQQVDLHYLASGIYQLRVCDDIQCYQSMLIIEH